MIKYLFFLMLCLFTLAAANIDSAPLMTKQNSAKEKLSDYGFFEGQLSAMQPKANVIPYDLEVPLFSDYAHKARFIQIPDNQKIIYNDKNVFKFPIGTHIIKTFFYYNDEKNHAKGKNIVETRILTHEESGWKAYEYVWNEAQNEAFLEVAGGDKEVTWRDNKGKKNTFLYSIPNQNQCKGCHNRAEVMTPIGPSARQLNHDFKYAKNTDNQLVMWKTLNILDSLPSENITKITTPNDHVRAYLDINCAHCHNDKGPAMTSGLFLDYYQKDSTALGFNKTPVAAGRGSGDKKFDIVKGYADESILVYRMLSSDSGEMMPELGRKMLHKEGIALVKAWVNNK